MTNPITNWFFRGQNTRIPNEATARWGNPLDYFKKNPDPTTLFGDDALQVGRSDKNFAAGRRGNPFGRPDQAFNPFRSADKGGPSSGPTPLGRQVVLRGIPFLSKYLGTGLTGAQLFGQGQEGSLLDQATEAMPDLQVGGFGINNNPETDIGKRVWDFLSNRASEIGTYRGGAVTEPIGTYKGGATVVPLSTIAGFGDVRKKDYDALQRKYQREYDEYINPKGVDPFAPPIRMADVPYTLPIQRSPYLIDKNLYWMDSPIKRDYSPSDLLNLMNTRYRV